MAGRIYVASTSFSITWRGTPLVVADGHTFREGHPLLEEYPQLFDELKPDFEYEAPVPAPPAKKVAPAPIKVSAPPKKADGNV